ncbi:MAG: hypothetical protein EP343_17610 [Deltaproteobacteria bacterium]|nr:MAG: hypothetical protein EP343_17610 [Deltaproteobacteria bacterium]
MLHWVRRSFHVQQQKRITLWCILGLAVGSLGTASLSCKSSSSKSSKKPSASNNTGRPAVASSHRVLPSPRLRSRYRSIAVGKQIKPAPRFQRWLRPYRARLQSRMTTVLARVDKAFSRQRPESSLGNLVADICFAKLRHMGSPVDIFITNLGGIRNDLSAGKVSVNATYEILPFENALVLTQVTGRELLQIMEVIAKRGGEPLAGATLQFAGKEAVVVRSTVGGKPIEPSRVYSLGTNDYLVTTGFLHKILKGKPLKQTGLTLRETFQWGLRVKAVSLQPRLDGRVKKIVAQPSP